MQNKRRAWAGGMKLGLAVAVAGGGGAFLGAKVTMEAGEDVVQPLSSMEAVVDSLQNELRRERELSEDAYRQIIRYDEWVRELIEELREYERADSRTEGMIQ